MRGFTILELTLAALFGVLLIGSATSSVVGDTQGNRTLLQADVPTLAVQSALRRIVEEISVASFVAEDRNGDGILDTSEDLNLNDTLDADWSLPDGTTASSLTFNRRFDLPFGEGGRPCTAYSSAIRYRLASGRILRETTHTATGRMLRTTLAHDISALRFTRRGSIVHVDIVVRLRDGQTRTVARSVLVRD